jgi:hypothetical protein
LGALFSTNSSTAGDASRQIAPISAGGPPFAVAPPGSPCFQFTDPTNISSSYSPCDACQFGSTTVADVQKFIEPALGEASGVNDLNSDKVVNVVDVQIAINDARGLGCSL